MICIALLHILDSDLERDSKNTARSAADIIRKKKESSLPVLFLRSTKSICSDHIEHYKKQRGNTTWNNAEVETSTHKISKDILSWACLFSLGVYGHCTPSIKLIQDNGPNSALNYTCITFAAWVKRRAEFTPWLWLVISCYTVMLQWQQCIK